MYKCFRIYYIQGLQIRVLMLKMYWDSQPFFFFSNDDGNGNCRGNENVKKQQKYLFVNTVFVIKMCQPFNLIQQSKNNNQNEYKYLKVICSVQNTGTV